MDPQLGNHQLPGVSSSSVILSCLVQAGQPVLDQFSQTSSSSSSASGSASASSSSSRSVANRTLASHEISSQSPSIALSLGNQTQAHDSAKAQMIQAIESPDVSLEALSERWQVYLVILYTLTAIVSFVLNALTVIVLSRCKRSELRKYLINLSMSDLLMSCFSIRKCCCFTNIHHAILMARRDLRSQTLLD